MALRYQEWKEGKASESVSMERMALPKHILFSRRIATNILFIFSP